MSFSGLMWQILPEAEPRNGPVAGRTPSQTVRADFPHTASQWSLKSEHYANTESRSTTTPPRGGQPPGLT